MDGFGKDLARGTEEGSATIIITNSTAALLVKWDQKLVLPIIWHLLSMPDGIKQGLEPPQTQHHTA